MTKRDISDEQAATAAARDGDEAGFTAVVKRYRRELHLHCYRMTGSLEDAEDLVQEAFLSHTRTTCWRAFQARNRVPASGSLPVRPSSSPS